jgi:hypothetical protein
MSANLHFNDSEWKRHYKHPPALCLQGNMHQMVKLGLCSRAEYTKSMSSVKGAKRRNEFWKKLGYPNLVRAREAKKEHARHLLEICAPVLLPRRVNAARGDA